MNQIVIPEWTPEEALTVTAFLEHVLRLVRQYHGHAIDRDRARHEWLSNEGHRFAEKPKEDIAF